ncbi:bifunctional diaminohydroxyphosphoribosylaminopyrimidine deaminase/5-amino-6-(5-phosphoribosylamino)uracil reductase RibD [Clostridium hydrogenum]|uniref:bifunctional diaminohydroxyphosphoribosylaminopyrimidine deaminase/5-amino-6-(5-phosphoribosylamino)uracil reductase RibD n=1 Tax=Clostridium hydrogenum TaxID=2855764 RepID=UPI001EEEEFCF|nr:bifunctional diaminohydroxyphosphoribosylaminopyrimidine deaminase/5-amino-6-(5-phosphoribosylamino)uracil reductase RibD [Clostridium hydrogenum]
MKRALELAEKGRGRVNPNPMVGAVIVKDNQIVGEGFHEFFGGNHAEVNALNMAGENAKGAEIYVTLEPCSHFGKTPPCALALIKAGIKRVIISMKDPNPIVSGRGIKILRDNGIEVLVGVLEAEAVKLNEIFVKYMETKTPYVLMKTAATLDGKISTISGESRWISSKASREYVHYLRNNMMAIMVGIGTIIADNPMLTTRLEGKCCKSPTAIIIDSKLRISLNSKILETLKERKVIIAVTEEADKNKIKQLEDIGVLIIKTPLKEEKVDLKYLMTKLGELGIDSILLEGGSTLNFSFLKEKLVDKVICFIAPIMLGGEKAKTPVGGIGIEKLSEAVRLSNMKLRTIGQDILVEGYIERE